VFTWSQPFRASSRAGVLALALAGCAFAPLARAEVTKEYQVKAAFLYNFTRFVEWPAACFPRPDSPIVIGLFGRNPFGDELQKVVRDRKVNGHPIVVVQLTTMVGAGPLQAVFVAAGEERRFERELAASPRLGVLTVGETERFADSGGIVNFTTVDDKVRFEINAAAAESAGLKVSAQLQKLASAPRHP
jgi:hypothetical protein